MPRPMKDSGVEWIGEIPADWKILRNKVLFYEVNERCTDANHYKLLSVSEYTGITPRSAIIKDGEYETHAETLDGYKICRAGDIVMNIMLAWKRATATSSYNGIVSPAYCVFRGKGVDTKYFHYLFRTDNCADMFKRYSTGIIDSRLRLYPNVFFSLKSIVPPLDEQQRIAAFLDGECARIDSVIEKTRASIVEYKKLKQAVITRAVTKGIRPARTMKDSGVEWLGEIPADFYCRKLKTFSDIISKGTTPKDLANEINDDYCIRYIKSENIVDNNLIDEPEFGIRLDTHEGELKRSQLSERDILFVIAGASIGKTAIMRKNFIPSNTNQATSFIRIKDKYIQSQKFIWYVLQSDIVKKYIALYAVQSAQPNLSMANLGDMRIPFPPMEEQKEIAQYLDEKTAAIDLLVEKKNQLATELERLKKSLIFEYVTGKKAVPQ